MARGSIRWGLLGAAGIAQGAFLPALREAGGGVPLVVGARDPARARSFATEHGVERAVQGYEAVVGDPEVDAVYVALPNALHAAWTIRALEAGKTVLCEKPLCISPEQTAAVLEVARGAGGHLWEAFVFPFNAQTARLQEILDEGEIGEPREVDSVFHFLLDDPTDIRMDAGLAGGALLDVGCYPVRLARLLFEAGPERAVAEARTGASGVDEELWGIVRFPDDRVLRLSCGFRRPYDTSTVLYGSRGTIRLTNPFHPEPADTLEIRRGVDVSTEHPTTDEHSFTAALRHIHDVIGGRAAPVHLALDDAPEDARAVAMLATAAGLERTGHPRS